MRRRRSRTRGPCPWRPQSCSEIWSAASCVACRTAASPGPAASCQACAGATRPYTTRQTLCPAAITPSSRRQSTRRRSRTGPGPTWTTTQTTAGSMTTWARQWVTGRSIRASFTCGAVRARAQAPRWCSRAATAPHTQPSWQTLLPWSAAARARTARGSACLRTRSSPRPCRTPGSGAQAACPCPAGASSCGAAGRCTRAGAAGRASPSPSAGSPRGAGTTPPWTGRCGWLRWGCPARTGPAWASPTRSSHRGHARRPLPASRARWRCPSGLPSSPPPCALEAGALGSSGRHCRTASGRRTCPQH
mmetsp:Transcript_55454/g.148521  ORF Transcript_55454/g.148521 Transcript_55454/m.148521 type:complete len:305 (+) Transcript_55454:388-1302(+)